MTVEERKELKLKIQDHIVKVKADIIEIEKMTQPVKPENSLGRISRIDSINNKSVSEDSLRNKKAKLTKLNVAVVKVDEEGFGYCQMCKNQIQPMRLMFMPESSRCVRCASR
jgi:DnaK suppressor protein